MVKCPKCEKELEDGTEICPFCNAVIRKDEVPYISELPPEERGHRIKKVGFAFKRERDDEIFGNPGEKIKLAARIFFHICSIISVIFSIGILLASITTSSGVLSFLISLLVCVIMAVLGIMFSWFIAVHLYGFGELIEKVSDIDEKTN